LKNAVTIKKAETNGVVAVGSTVTVKKGDKTVVYTIVGSYEAKPEEGRISDESPIGKAFMNHKVGEKVTITTPAGAMAYEIVKVD
jgi:transcription elongation factor GreA